jgi:DNA-directed RNA polymerase specialized sigma24 family protein
MNTPPSPKWRDEGADEGVKSALENGSRNIRQTDYQTPDGDELWQVILVVAASQIRADRSDRHAAERQLHRAKVSVPDQNRLEPYERVRESSTDYLELVLEDILEQLPPQNRVMVALRLDGCEVAEVARMTRRSARTVERLLNESRLKLVSLLKKGD